MRADSPTRGCVEPLFAGLALVVACATASAASPATAAVRTLTAATRPVPSETLPDFDKWWDYDHPDQTEKRFRTLLQRAKRSGNLSYSLELQTQIARCQGLQDRFNECQRTLDDVEKQLSPGVPVAEVRYLLERGRAFNSMDQSQKAIPFFQKAWEQARAIGNKGYAIDAVHMMALADSDTDQQVEWNRRALELAAHDPAQAGWLPPILNNLGEVYRARKEYAQALDCFERRAAWFKDRGREPDMFTIKDIARMNRLLGRATVGLRLIEPIAKRLDSAGQPNGYIDAEYGQCLVAVGQGDEARPFLRRAYAALSKDPYMVKYEPEELRHIRNLAESKQ